MNTWSTMGGIYQAIKPFVKLNFSKVSTFKCVQYKILRAEKLYTIRLESLMSTFWMNEHKGL